MKILLFAFSLTLILCFPYLPPSTSCSLPELREGHIFQIPLVHLKKVLSDDPALMLLVNCILWAMELFLISSSLCRSEGHTNSGRLAGECAS